MCDGLYIRKTPSGQQPADQPIYALCMTHNVNNQMGLARKFKFTPIGGGQYSRQDLAVKEFRYDGDRQRYLDRNLQPGEPQPCQESCPVFYQPIENGNWHDYLGNSVWCDYEVARDQQGSVIYPDVSALRLYTYGLGLVSDQVGVSGSRRYFHGDQIGSTRAMTDSNGGVGTLPVTIGYTAFGERLNATGSTLTRYGYAGAHGYQSDGLADGAATVLDDDVLGLLHVGARWYDPAIGRFISRDPIGIAGGLNVYVYCGNNPNIFVDPSGEAIFSAIVAATVAYGFGWFTGVAAVGGTPAPWWANWFIAIPFSALYGLTVIPVVAGGRATFVGRQMAPNAKFIPRAAPRVGACSLMQGLGEAAAVFTSASWGFYSGFIAGAIFELFF